VQFFEVAREYCAWAEAPPADSTAEAMQALRMLSTVYHHALGLPGADLEDLPEHEILQKGEDTMAIYTRFKALPFQYYSEIFDPAELPAQEFVTGDLADDLMDTYIDLKQGLLYYDAGHPAQAVFHWRFMFGVHWGRHATSAMRALHCYLTAPTRNDEQGAG
jgi:hypothetical protein